MPPASDEVDAFVADSDPAAYEKLVDRLLSSPAYGQRMAWDWLDAARYADSNGYQGDGERTMWPWRDWVVEAFNRNMRFDEFTIWQLAGDLLPDASFEQRLATGFCRNHMINGEGGRIAEENRVDYVMDMSETMGTVWLGLTLNCCRCHDHKFDPLKQTEYYQLSAFFNQTPVDGGGGDPQAAPALPAPTAEQAIQLAAAEQALADASAALDGRVAELLPGQPDWERQWTSVKRRPGTRLTPTEPESRASGPGLAGRRHDSGQRPEPGQRYLHHHGHDRSRSPDRFAARGTPSSVDDRRRPGPIGQWQLRPDRNRGHAAPPGQAEPQTLKFVGAEATFEQPGFSV